MKMSHTFTRASIAFIVASISLLHMTDVRAKSVILTSEEKSLAKTLGYNTKVLLKIKEVLEPEMGIVKIGGFETPDRKFLSQDIQSAAQEKLALAELEQSSVASFTPAKGNRILRISAAIKEYSPLMRQEAQDLLGCRVGKGFLNVASDSPILDSDEETDKLIREFKEYYKDKALRPENQRKAVLALKFRKSGDHIDSALGGVDQRLTELNREIEDKGYKLISEKDIVLRREFKTEQEALEFLKSEGKTPNNANFIKVVGTVTNFDTPVSIPTGKLSASEISREIKEIAPGKYQIIRPAGYRAISFRKVAILQKLDQEKPQ